MSKLTDIEVKNLSEDSYKTESLGRGRGALMIRKRGRSFIAFYRYWKGKQKAMVPIGSYKAMNKSAGFTLAQLRERALELAAIRQRIEPQDLKEYLEQQELEREHQVREKKKQAEAEDSKGTLTDLLNAYTATLHKREASSARDITTSLNTNVIKAFPKLAATKAADIGSDDIVMILRKLLERGNTSNYNRVRSYLLAAFNQGMKADYDPREQLNHGKRFNIQFNPVAAIPRHADLETVRKRQLDNEEIQTLWATIESTCKGWSLLYAYLVKFMFACYGNRPKQLARCSWSDVDYRNRTLTFIDRKGKKAIAKERVIPLTHRAMGILEEVRKLSGGNPGPFWIGKKAPIGERNLSRFIFHYNDWLEEQAKAKGEDLSERFTTKDIRRTVTRLLTDCRILREQRYLLQSREDGSIESKHYDHDDRIPEKRDAAKIYDHYLEQIITGTLPEKVVDIEQYRQKT